MMSILRHRQRMPRDAASIRPRHLRIIAPVEKGLYGILCQATWHGHLGRVFSRAGSPCHENSVQSQARRGRKRMHQTRSLSRRTFIAEAGAAAMWFTTMSSACARRIQQCTFCPAAAGRPFPTESGLDQRRTADRTPRASRQIRPSRFLDPRLHQLYAHHPRVAEIGEGVAQRIGGDRRPLGQVRERTRFAKHQSGRTPLSDQASRGQRREVRHLEQFRRAGMADVGADRSRGIRGLGA